MTRTQQWTDRTVALILSVAAVLFFSVWYGFHTVNLEQLQLFEGTWPYFAETVLVPGGFADYLGRFLSQFFYYAWVGALILVALLALIRTLLLTLCLRKDALVGALGFIPPVLLAMTMCLRFPTVSLLTAFALALAAAWAVSRIRNVRTRRITTLLLIPVLYFLLGSFTVLFAAVMAVRERGKAFGLVALLLAVACPFIAWLLLPYPFSRLLYGLSYYKVHFQMPVWPWLAVLTAVALVALAKTRAADGAFRAWPALYAAVIAVAVSAVLLCSNFSDEQSMKYNILTGKRLWNRILNEASRKAPKTYSEIACLNLSLCKTGHLGGHMFDFHQDGPETLLPNENTPHHDGLSTAEIFYQTGMVNNAQRYCFEALNAIPDYQKSAPVCKLLAEICIVNGKYELAREYLTALSHTLFYKKWAEERLIPFREKTDPSLIDEYAQKRLERYKLGDDYIFDYSHADFTLRQLVEEYPGNLTAINYLLAWHLLTKNLSGFVAECPFEAFTTAVPKAWQEGFLLDWVQSGSSMENLPSFISDEEAYLIQTFSRDFDANVPMDEMQRRYGNTYWFYYFFK
jgi:hypothetical protein